MQTLKRKAAYNSRFLPRQVFLPYPFTQARCHESVFFDLPPRHNSMLLAKRASSPGQNSYKRLAWQQLERLALGGKDIVVMKKEL